MTSRTETVLAEGFTLSRMVWALLRRQPRGFVELIHDRNPGLAALGPFLPVGTKVVFPVDEIPSTPVEEDVVRLWD